MERSPCQSGAISEYAKIPLNDSILVYAVVLIVSRSTVVSKIYRILRSIVWIVHYMICHIPKYLQNTTSIL